MHLSPEDFSWAKLWKSQADYSARNCWARPRITRQFELRSVLGWLRVRELGPGRAMLGRLLWIKATCIRGRSRSTAVSWRAPFVQTLNLVGRTSCQLGGKSYHE